jgi:hypothetical protein
MREYGMLEPLREAWQKAKMEGTAKMAHVIYPNTAAGAVNYAVEEIPGLATSIDIEAVPFSGAWLVRANDQEKAYIVNLRSEEGSYVSTEYYVPHDRLPHAKAWKELFGKK